jgi:hypothetical protein
VHDCRPRTFRLIVEHCVRIIRRHLAVAMWRLQKEVHRLPSFALPHKQFVKQVVCEKSKQFLEPSCSFRDTVHRDGQSLMYEDRQGEPLAEHGAALAVVAEYRGIGQRYDRNSPVTQAPLASTPALVTTMSPR